MATAPSRINHQDITIGTLAPMDKGGTYLSQVVEHGFESFELTCWQYLGGVDLKKLSEEAKEALGDQAITFPQDDHGTAATDVCVHGHCHHFAPFVPAQNVADVGLALHRIKQDVERDSVRKTDLHFGLKRPPRA